MAKKTKPLPKTKIINGKTHNFVSRHDSRKESRIKRNELARKNPDKQYIRQSFQRDGKTVYGIYKRVY